MKYLGVLYQSALTWSRDDMSHYAAAFSYYAPFALIPLVLLSVGVSGFFYGISFVKNIFLSWGTVFGKDLLALIDIAVQNLDIEVNTYEIPVLAIIFFSSVSIFAFNVLALGFKKTWKIHELGFKNWFKQSLRSVSFIIILQIYIFVIIGIEGLLTAFEMRSVPLSLLVWFASISAVFMLFYRFLVSGSPSLKGCLVGGMTAGVLFIFAKNLVGLYLQAKPVLTVFGAAGLILVLLVWIYVLAAIVYYGATVAYLYDNAKKGVV